LVRRKMKRKGEERQMHGSGGLALLKMWVKMVGDRQALNLGY
jgi:hypothetical protein